MDAPSPEATAVSIADIPALEARETSGLTSRLLLTYAKRNGGREAVEAILHRCGLDDRERDLHDENHWFSYAAKLRLFEAASEVLDDPHVTRHVGELALELGVGDGLKAALRSLGTPGLVYRNVVRANAKFDATHSMELVELERQRALIRVEDIAGVGFHRLDCDYNVGLLSCVPALFGRAPARVSHPVCQGAGGDACVYAVSWAAEESPVRFSVAAATAGAAAVAGSAALAPSLLPAGIAAALVAGAAAVWRAWALGHRQRRKLEDELREQARVGDRLTASLLELAGELRLDDVLAKITGNAQAAVGGNEFALLLEDERGCFGCLSSSGLPIPVRSALERWAGERPGDLSEPIVVDDLALVPELELATRDEVMPLRSLCAVPLVYRGGRLGALVALSGPRRTFLPRDVDRLGAYAVQAALALANARLFEAQERLAARDPLTGLLNRRELLESVARERDRCRRSGGHWSIALYDLDGFKLVNDADGHSKGDAVLRAVADAIAGSCRAADVAFRLGGDEFAVLLPDTDGRAAASTHADRTRAAVAAVDPRLGASFGVATWPDDGDHVDALLSVADRRLYAMKGVRLPDFVAGSLGAADGDRRARLAVASRLSARLAPLRDVEDIVRATVSELQDSLGYSLAVVQRADADGQLRALAATGPLARFEPSGDQSVHKGICGRVARTGQPALVGDTSQDPDFITADVPTVSRSELALPIRVGGKVWGVLNVESAEPDAFDVDDLLLADTVAAQVGSALQVARLLDGVESTLTTTISVLSDALEAKDPYTAAHTREVAELCERVAARLGIAGDERRTLRYAALLHDIGKIGVREDILGKPAPLAEDELAAIEEHTVIGARMLERIPGMEAVMPLIRSAHERWDGAGYPDGLAGAGIPKGARVICACDALHAMSSERPYRSSVSVAEAVVELRRCAGAQFDPDVVEALVAELDGDAPPLGPETALP